MNNIDKYINKTLDEFQANKGRASMYCYTTHIIPKLVSKMLIKYVNKHPDKKVFIVVDTYENREKIDKYFINNGINKDTYKFKILTSYFVKMQYHYCYDMCIIVGITNINLITKLANENKFVLAILTKNIMDNNFINSVRNILPAISTIDIDNVIKIANIYSPVKEYRYGVELSTDDKALYDKCDEYITTCVKIFGDIANIEKCKKGDTILGISAAEFRNNIASENGWREDLDTSVPFMQQIDELYNPNILYERTCIFYNIIKQRRDIVVNNNAKLEVIKNICLDNKDKRTLILSKSGDFAKKITKYLNNTGEINCGDYHDCIDTAIEVDDNGIPVVYKSGVNAGKPRMLQSQAQSTINERKFNAGIIKILSAKLSSNVKLNIACDLVILTTPLFDTIVDIKTRFANVKFEGVQTLLYKIYCKDTIEQNKLDNILNGVNVEVIDKTENFSQYEESNCGIIL